MHRRPIAVRAGAALILATFPAVAVNGCSNDGGTTATIGDASVDGGVVLQPNVVILPDSLMRLAIVSNAAVSFPPGAPVPSVSAGTIIVSGYGDGLLRRVENVATTGTKAVGLRLQGLGGSGITWNTGRASLTDAVASASFHWTYEPSPLSVDATQLLAGTSTAGWTISATGSVAPRIEITGQIEDGKVIAFRTKLTTKVTDSLNEAISFDGDQSWQGSVPITSASSRFVEFLGPIPVVGTVGISVSAGYSAGITANASVSLGETCSLTHTDDIAYDPTTGWSSNDTSAPQCTSQPPTLDLQARADAKAYLEPTIQLGLWGIGGPSLAAEVGAHASVNACPPPSDWSLDAYVSGSLAIDASVLGIGVQYNHALGEVTYPISSGALQTPAACSDGGADAGEAGSDGPETQDGPLEADANAGPDASGPDAAVDSSAVDGATCPSTYAGSPPAYMMCPLTTMPTGTGGIIPDGIYYPTVFYTSTVPPGTQCASTATEWMFKIVGSQWEYYEPSSAITDIYTVSESGPDLSFAVACCSLSPPSTYCSYWTSGFQWQYSVASSGITLIGTGNGNTVEYVLQPWPSGD